MSVSHAQPDDAGQQVISALWQLFGQLADPRRPRGGAAPAGCGADHHGADGAGRAGNSREAGDQAADLPEAVGRLDGLAIDGKTIRNSAAAGGGADVRLFSALPHHENAELAMERDVLKRSVVLWVKEVMK